MADEDLPKAAVIFNDDDEESDEEEEAEEELETLGLIPRSQQPPNEDAFDEDEEEEEEEDAVLPSFATPEPKRFKIEPIRPEEKKASAADESRKLFQRLWTDEDEIELLQGFLNYTAQRGTAHHHHHDTALFYDQIKGKFQLEFNKNQLVEKLRRLKKKYRNVVARISSGKDFSFKTHHDQATFEIARKIWTNAGPVSSSVADHNSTFEEDDANPTPTPTPTLNLNNPNHHNPTNPPTTYYLTYDGMGMEERKAPRPRKRAPAKSPDKKPAAAISNNSLQLGGCSSIIPGLIEESVKSCLSPLLKEVLQSAVGGQGGIRGGGYGGVAAALNPMALGFGGPPPSILNVCGGDEVDEKWRKQQILELEVFAKRLELMQDQIKSLLEELKSKGPS